jgi:hypothetical protein
VYGNVVLVCVTVGDVVAVEEDVLEGVFVNVGESVLVYVGVEVRVKVGELVEV